MPLMPEVDSTLWSDCLESLARELPEQQFNTWIKPLAAQVEADDARLTLTVANRFKLDWIRTQYAGRIVALLEQISGHPVQLELALAPRAHHARTEPRHRGRGPTQVVDRLATAVAAEPAPGDKALAQPTLARCR